MIVLSSRLEARFAKQHFFFFLTLIQMRKIGRLPQIESLNRTQ